MTGRAAVLTLVLAILMVSYAYPLRTWYEQHNERSALEQEAAELREMVDQLETELELWDDPAYVAIQARQRLGYVMPGEQGFVVIHPEAEEDETGPEGLPPVGDGAWHERLWASVLAADEPPEEDLP
ncbi:FtsB family cell division protein [Phytoactinopolyspora limicola]|uniref:FtsB family cell division protein n=1 Tax=Phytoactinopolyspora limicola TaxID=2715536 RepID=UPI0014077AB1|nr:septum formation initiator family protein [Phytoactinopolyspora limicola]